MTKIEDFKDKHEGERIFIIGNGPSLKETPLEKLQDEYTLAINSIYKIFPETEWRPSYYFISSAPNVASTPNNTENNYFNKILSSDIDCFINKEYDFKNNNLSNVYFFERVNLLGNKVWNSSSIEEMTERPIGQLKKFWSDELSHHIYTYHSIYGAIQVADYMGFNKIYFLGCDLGMEYKNPHMVFDTGLDPCKYEKGFSNYFRDSFKTFTPIRSFINGLSYRLCQKIDENYILEKLIGKKDNSHFNTRYLDRLAINEGEKHSYQIKKSHAVAKKICDSKSIELYNATIGGELEVYPRIKLEDIIR